MDMEFLRTIEGKARRDRIRNNGFREAEIHYLLRELEEYDNNGLATQRMDRTRTLRRASELEFKGMRPLG